MGRPDIMIAWRPGYASQGLRQTADDWKIQATRETNVSPQIVASSCNLHVARAVQISDAIIYTLIMKD